MRKQCDWDEFLHEKPGTVVFSQCSKQHHRAKFNPPFRQTEASGLGIFLQQSVVMSQPYFPGQQSRQYHRLPSVQRDAIRKEVDRRFREKTGVMRSLDPTTPKDLNQTRL